MKHRTAVLSFAAALLLSAPAIAQTSLNEADAALVDGFQYICLDGLPDFDGAAEALESQGFEVYPFGDDELEFFRETPVPFWGYISSGGCSLSTDIVNLKSASSALTAILAARYGAEPEPWHYQGEFSGWTVPFDGQVLYVIVNDADEPDVARAGFSAELRDK